MDKVLFFANIYWDIHWMYNVIKAMDGTVYADNDTVEEMCHQMKLKVTRTVEPNWKILVSTNMHMSANRLGHMFINSGGKSVIMQHCWDPSLNLYDNFWNLDMSEFSYYLVGCTQDEKWLGEKFGNDKIINTGIPKLDDLYRIKNKDINLDDVYKDTGTKSFYLSIAPTDAISVDIYNAYMNDLIPASPLPVVFKLHPGTLDSSQTGQTFDSLGRNDTILVDNMYDRNYIYKLIKASSGIVCVESFMSIEASLMGKPVIFHGFDKLPLGFYDKPENVNQIQRAPIGMSSTLTKPEFKQEQQEIVDMYKFDGQNTQRVVTFLKSLYNTL